MPAECSPTLFDFARAEGRCVVASFDGGRITSDAGALLLGATDRVINGVVHLRAGWRLAPPCRSAGYRSGTGRDPAGPARARFG